uniref:Uncharacterized protein n=1 Tax=Rhizophora mucronata TaxID=61149 RepID=A0A2P2LY74_RHIMU
MLEPNFNLFKRKFC